MILLNIRAILLRKKRSPFKMAQTGLCDLPPHPDLISYYPLPCSPWSRNIASLLFSIYIWHTLNFCNNCPLFLKVSFTWYPIANYLIPLNSVPKCQFVSSTLKSSPSISSTFLYVSHSISHFLAYYTIYLYIICTVSFHENESYKNAGILSVSWIYLSEHP